jgi:transposase
MDNLTVHKSKVVNPFYEKLNIMPIWNVPYSPEFNPIESVFSRVKFFFNKKRLNEIVNRRGFNFDRTIEASFQAITVEHCRACVRKSKKLLKEA